MLTVLMLFRRLKLFECREDSASLPLSLDLCFHLSGKFSPDVKLKEIVLFQDSRENFLAE